MTSTLVYIEHNADKLSGTPVFKGTRIPIAIFFDYLESGSSVAAFLDDFEIDHPLVLGFVQALREQTCRVPLA